MKKRHIAPQIILLSFDGKQSFPSFGNFLKIQSLDMHNHKKPLYMYIITRELIKEESFKSNNRKLSAQNCMKSQH